MIKTHINTPRNPPTTGEPGWFNPDLPLPTIRGEIRAEGLSWSQRSTQMIFSCDGWTDQVLNLPESSRLIRTASINIKQVCYQACLISWIENLDNWRFFIMSVLSQGEQYPPHLNVIKKAAKTTCYVLDYFWEVPDLLYIPRLVGYLWNKVLQLTPHCSSGLIELTDVVTNLLCSGNVSVFQRDPLHFNVGTAPLLNRLKSPPFLNAAVLKL